MSTTQNDSSGVIEEVQTNLKKLIGEEGFILHFTLAVQWEVIEESATINLILSSDTATIGYLKNKYSQDIRAAINSVSKKIAFTWRNVPLTKASKSRKKSTPQRKPLTPVSSLPGMETIRLQLPVGQTFETFSVGENNAFAHSVCQDMATTVTKKHTKPLFIHGPTGYGKSHLLYAVIKQVLETTKLIPTYTMVDIFAEEMYQAIKSNTMSHFKAKYSASKIFLIDDIHMLKGKEKTQKELLIILKILTKKNVPIITTSTINPLGLADFISDELLSLLASGIIAPIESVKQMTKRAIIKHYAQEAKLVLNENIIDYLAQTLNGDIRKITSIIATLDARSSLLGQTIDLRLTESIVRNILAPANNALTSKEILELVAGEFKVSTKGIISKSRKKILTTPRHLIMWLAANHTKETHEMISATVGRKRGVDHARKTVEAKLLLDPVYRRQIELLKAKIEL